MADLNFENEKYKDKISALVKKYRSPRYKETIRNSFSLMSQKYHKMLRKKQAVDDAEALVVEYIDRIQKLIASSDKYTKTKLDDLITDLQKASTVILPTKGSSLEEHKRLRVLILMYSVLSSATKVALYHVLPNSTPEDNSEIFTNLGNGDKSDDGTSTSKKGLVGQAKKIASRVGSAVENLAQNMLRGTNTDTKEKEAADAAEAAAGRAESGLKNIQNPPNYNVFLNSLKNESNLTILSTKIEEYIQKLEKGIDEIKTHLREAKDQAKKIKDAGFKQRASKAVERAETAFKTANESIKGIRLALDKISEEMQAAEQAADAAEQAAKAAAEAAEQVANAAEQAAEAAAAAAKATDERGARSEEKKAKTAVRGAKTAVKKAKEAQDLAANKEREADGTIFADRALRAAVRADEAYQAALISQGSVEVSEKKATEAREAVVKAATDAKTKAAADAAKAAKEEEKQAQAKAAAKAAKEEEKQAQAKAAAKAAEEEKQAQAKAAAKAAEATPAISDSRNIIPEITGSAGGGRVTYKILGGTFSKEKPDDEYWKCDTHEDAAFRDLYYHIGRSHNTNDSGSKANAQPRTQQTARMLTGGQAPRLQLSGVRQLFESRRSSNKEEVSYDYIELNPPGSKKKYHCSICGTDFPNQKKHFSTKQHQKNLKQYL
jgi:hypothetical protein